MGQPPRKCVSTGQAGSHESQVGVGQEVSTVSDSVTAGVVAWTLHRLVITGAHGQT
jgi:hypothetical protein